MNKEQIIYVDDKPYIKCNVVMLSTNNKSDLRLIRGYDGNVLGYNPLMSSAQLHNNKDSTISYHHLYITSDEEIKEGDWIIWNNKVVKAINTVYSKDTKKIIATTDNTISIHLGKEYNTFPDGSKFLYNRLCPFPKPSQQFIEKYIEEYNKGNQIVDVLVEITDSYLEVDYTSKLKLDSQNQITIRKHKDSWSREEVNELCKSAYVLGANNQQIFIDNSSSEIKRKETPFNEWIEENL